MEVFLILFPITILFSAVILGFLLWAILSGQYEDLDSKSHSFLIKKEESDE